MRSQLAKKLGLLRVLLFCVFPLFAGCATTAYSPHEDDPLQGMNRQIFEFNEVVDKYTTKPAAIVYKNYTPEPAQTAVHNFFANLGEVKSFINWTLQFNLKFASTNVMRFALNSVFGFFGLMDIATDMKLQEAKTNVSETLEFYGVGAGPYLVMPLLGPGDLRSAASIVPSVLINPLRPNAPISLNNNGSLNLYASLSILLVDLIDKRARLLGIESVMVGDRYSFMRDAYLQRRKAREDGGLIQQDSFSSEDEDAEEEQEFGDSF